MLRYSEPVSEKASKRLWGISEWKKKLKRPKGIEKERAQGRDTSTNNDNTNNMHESGLKRIEGDIINRIDITFEQKTQHESKLNGEKSRDFRLRCFLFVAVVSVVYK